MLSCGLAGKNSCQSSGFYPRIEVEKGDVQCGSVKPSPAPELKLLVENLDLKFVFEKYHLPPRIGSVETTQLSGKFFISSTSISKSLLLKTIINAKN